MDVKLFLKPTAQFVALAVLLSAFAPSGVYSEPSLQVTVGLEVRDANNKKVGNVVGIDFGTPSVAFNIDGRVIVLKLTKTRFFGSGTIVFQSTDCTGPPLFHIGPGLVGESVPGDHFVGTPVAVFAPSQTVYFPDLAVSPQTVTVQSFGMSSVSSAPTCSPVIPGVGVFPFPVQVVPAVPLIDLSTRFTPPFRLRTLPPSGPPNNEG